MVGHGGWPDLAALSLTGPARTKLCVEFLGMVGFLLQD